MGLAATQARFLGITARKANCEFQSMQIAQQKLSLTRELEKATQEYQSALNASKLIWDPDGSGENVYDLSYNIMMTPSAVNNFTPYMISARDGKIVLNSKMAAAAEAAGIPKEGCDPNADPDMYTKFLNYMVKFGGMSQSHADSCKAAGLLEDVGLGAPLLDKTTASEMGINDLLAYLDIMISNENTLSGEDKALVDALKFNFGVGSDGNPIPDLNLQTALDDKGDANQNYFVVNGNRTSETEFDLTDLLTNDITFAQTGDKNKNGFWKKIVAGVAAAFTGGFAFWTYNGILDMLNYSMGEIPEGGTPADMALLSFLDEMFMGYAELLDIENADKTTQNSFQYAIQETLALLSGSNDLGNRNHSIDAFNDAVKGANDYNGWVTKGANKNKNYGTRAISLSNLAESFMTLYAQAENGFDQSYYINKRADQSSYVTDDPYYMWVIGDPDAETTMDMYVAEFYSALFNNICQNGWVENERIDDKEYLSNSLLNAQYFITSMSSDNYYYQDRYTENGYVAEVTDDDAITQAELAYTLKKNKLNSKEEELDLDMQKLDLEISALSTEYETVKQMINNNVEKTFTMFNS